MVSSQWTFSFPVDAAFRQGMRKRIDCFNSAVKINLDIFRTHCGQIPENGEIFEDYANLDHVYFRLAKK
jgi:hypothetical protein